MMNEYDLNKTAPKGHRISHRQRTVTFVHFYLSSNQSLHITFLHIVVNKLFKRSRCLFFQLILILSYRNVWGAYRFPVKYKWVTTFHWMNFVKWHHLLMSKSFRAGVWSASNLHFFTMDIFTYVKRNWDSKTLIFRLQSLLGSKISFLSHRFVKWLIQMKKKCIILTINPKDFHRNAFCMDCSLEKVKEKNFDL